MFRLFEVDARFSFGLLVFTPKTIIYGFRYSWLIQDSPSGYWLSPRRNFIWGFSYPSWWKILLRAIGFHPEANNSPYGLRQSMFYAGSSFGLLDFTPKQNTVICGNDHTLVLWNFIWPSVIGVLEKGAPKSLSLSVKRRGESSAHCK